MSEPITLSAAELNQAVYVGVAFAKKDPALDILAGVVCHMLLEHTGLSSQEISAATDELHNAINVHRPDPQFDLSPNNSILTTRILARVVPTLTNPALRSGAKRYTRAFLKSHKGATHRFQQVTPIELLFDHPGEVDQFRSNTWRTLHELARDNPSVAEAVDQSQITASLGVKTTQGAATMVELPAFEPLKKFVSEHLQPDGGLVVPSETVSSVLDALSSSVEELRKLYADNLKNINDAEEKARKGEGGLGELINKAIQNQDEIDKRFTSIGEGVNGTFAVIAFSVDRFDHEFAADIREFASITMTMIESVQKFTKAAITTAQVFKQIVKASASQLMTGGALAFGAVMIVVAIQLSGLLGKSRQKPIEEVILEQLDKISKQITSLRDELRVRFDRIDKRLDKIYAGIVSRLAEINFTVGEISGNVEEIQLALGDLHSELLRLHSNVHAFLEAANRRDFVEAVNGFLNFRELTGQEISFEDFLEGENVFFSWGFNHAKDPLQAGPDNRSFQDDDLITELTTFTLSTNVNYLRLWPAARAGLPALSLNRLPNPFDWVVAGEAYAQLCEESESHALQISPSRVADLIRSGEALADSLSRIANKDLFGSLTQLYRNGFAQLKASISSEENVFRIRPDTGLRGLNLWGGPHQTPSSNFFVEEFDQLRRCDGNNFDESTATVSGTIFGFDHSQLTPYMIASNLSNSTIQGVAESLNRLSACVSANWETTQVEELGFNQMVRVRYRMVVAVQVRYGAATAFLHRITTDIPHKATVRKDRLPMFDPATDPQQGKDPYRILVDPGNPLWHTLGNYPASHELVDPALLNATTTLVASKLKLLQRVFYAEVARRFTQGGDPIRQAAWRFTGLKLLWQAFVVTGLPLSSEANEILRSFLFGSKALLAGADLESEDSSLDDVEDLYSYFASRNEDPPDVNILVDIETLANARLDELAATLTEIVESIEASGQREPPELFAPTLLRLRLIHS